MPAPDMPARPVILFDVMETLVSEPFYTSLPDFFGLSLDELLKQQHPTTWIDFERGIIDEEEFLASFFCDGRSVDQRALRGCLLSSYRWLDGMQSVVAELKQASYEMHTLSNYSSWYQLIDQSLNLSAYLEWTFVSCKTGLRKPDPEAYLNAANHLNVRTSDCLFIDDREENVAAAEAVGMPSIRRESTAQLRRELAAWL